MEMEIKSEYVNTNGITLHLMTAGPEKGPLVLLLHGFPEFWYGWRHHIEPLAAAGYRVIVPDQRGYNLSDKPTGIENYTIDTLRDDIIGLIEQQEQEKAFLVGHDWGGAVAWHIASTRPEYVEKLIPINMPHPAAMPEVMKTYPVQAVLSSYILFFQLPWLPEKVICANRFQFIKQAFHLTSRNGTFSKEEIEKYDEAWRQPETVTSMLNWYRALRKGTYSQINNQPVTVPVRIIWGRRDQFLSIELVKKSLQLCIDKKAALIDEATHWVTHEQPETVNGLIQRFIEEK